MTYDDIIDMKYPYPSNHPKMDIASRAAIFAPFAALSGHSEAIVETARLTDQEIVIDDDLRQKINDKLIIIYLHIKSHPQVLVTYFIKDKYKEGGKYITVQDNIKKIDLYKKTIILVDKTIIPMEDIIDIELMSKDT